VLTAGSAPGGINSFDWSIICLLCYEKGSYVPYTFYSPFAEFATFILGNADAGE